MEFIYNNQTIVADDAKMELLLNKYKEKYMFGMSNPRQQGYCMFNNIAMAIYMFGKHVTNRSKIALHTDVDVDGIATTYILQRYLHNIGIRDTVCMINKDKVHGIKKEYNDFIKSNNIQLLIITDSSCNDIDIFKEFDCDVLVIDHHELLHNNLYGKCKNGVNSYVIVNNTIDNMNFDRDKSYLMSIKKDTFDNIDEYKKDSRMSCGVVVYEFLRVFGACTNSEIILSNLQLYQWAGISLFTDSIELENERNQWYINNTVHNSETEATLKILMNNINRYKKQMDKTFIEYSLAPIVNKAIRAGKGNEALNIIIYNPSDIMKLDKYKELQDEAINKTVYENYESINTLIQKYTEIYGTKEKALEQIGLNGINIGLIEKKYSKPYIIENLTKYNISKNYAGVIAGRLSGNNNKNCACYIENNGLVEGSFRGVSNEIDYRKIFDEYDESVYAQGHPPAFGFKCKIEQLEELMKICSKDVSSSKEYFSVGNMPESEYGVYHIKSFEQFRLNKYLLYIGIVNSNTQSRNAIKIKVCINDIILKEIKGKLFIYDVFGLECKAFSRLKEKYYNVYIEYTNELCAYLK